jgi:hypothetical protein
VILGYFLKRILLLLTVSGVLVLLISSAAVASDRGVNKGQTDSLDRSS